MRNTCIAAIVAAVVAICVQTAPAEAALIAYWHFNDGSLTVDEGAGLMTVSGREPEFGAGTMLNALPGVSAGHGFAISGDGDFVIDFAIDTRGFEDVMFSFALRADPSWRSNLFQPGGVQVTYFYSADGAASFVPIGQFTPGAEYAMFCAGQRVTDPDFGVRPEDLPCFTGAGGGGAALAAFDNNPNFVFRITQFPFGLEPGDQFLIDNVTVWGVPEPPFLALFGVGAAAFGGLRRRWSRGR